ncbi:MAG: cytochrome c oxidase subunit II [Acidimicrobiia bacterium]
MNRLRRVRRAAPFALLVGLALTSALFVAGCSSNENGQNSLKPAGRNARLIDDLFIPVLLVATVIGVLVVTATVVFAIKFRHREGTDDNPKQIHGSTPLEIGWTIVPALILAVVAVPTIATIFRIAEEPQGEVLRATVVGKQWWWEAQYDKQDTVSGTNIDQTIVTANEIHMIAGVPLKIDLQAVDVIHSFWIPELGGKQDVIPGRKQHITFYADEPGTYMGACAEFCGLSHANMRMRVIAQTREDFNAWMRGQQRGPAQPYTGEIADLTGATFACTNCHVFDDSSKAVYGPNLTHLASRSTFAGGEFELNRKNLVDWILNAPGMIPMQSKTCREPGAVPGDGCIGMPSFSKDTPKGLPVMTRPQAETIADYLLAER